MEVLRKLRTPFTKGALSWIRSFYRNSAILRTPPRGRRLLRAAGSRTEHPGAYPECPAQNRAALSKTYFGRIDYYDETYRSQECCYIGKNGITRNQTDVVVVDWRAPVSSVYYENEIGQGSYDVPEASRISIDLQKNVPTIFLTGSCLAFMTMTLRQTTNCW